MTRSNSQRLALGLACAAIGAVTSGAVALAETHSGHPHRAAHGHRAHPHRARSAVQAHAAAATVAEQASSDFPVFARARTASDTIPASIVASFNQSLGLDPSQSRLIEDNAGVTAWLVPASSVLCVVLHYKNAPGTSGSASGLGCAPVSDAESTGLVSLFDHDVVAGALPSGTSNIRVDSPSGATPISATDDGAVYYLSSSGVSGISFINPSGTSETVDNASGPGAPAP
jgi:hypothetical protein